MKRKITYLIFTFFIAFFFFNKAYSQYTSIPDSAFEKQLILRGIENGTVDGKILTSKISGITNLSVFDTSIADLTGIEGFVNLEELYFAKTKVKTIDLSSNIKLKKLKANNNEIIKIDLSKNVGLTYLQLLGNQISKIDLTQNILLETLDLVWNKLDSLNLSKNIYLKEINVSNNKLVHFELPDSGSQVERLICGTNALRSINLSEQKYLEIFSIQITPLDSLNLTKNRFLKTVTASYCNISVLDVSQNTELIQLGCYNSRLKSIDISQNSNLKRAYFMNNDLRAIYAKNGSNEELHVKGNDSLSFVCVDSSQIGRARYMIDSVGLTQCDIGTSCTYPNKNSTTRVSFRSWLANSVGNCDSLKTEFPYLKYSFESNGDKNYYITNKNGYGQFFLEDEYYKISPMYDADLLNCTPKELIADFRRSSKVKKKDFCLSFNKEVLDVGIKVIALGGIRPGLTGRYSLIYFNNGSQSVSGKVSLTFPDSLLQFLFADIAPAEIKNNLLSWNYGSLKPYETRRIVLSFRANKPNDSIPLDGGDLLCFKSNITPLKLDTFKKNNEAILKQRVVNSKDPNDIRCLQGATVSNEMVGEFIDYAVRFENTGSAAALQVRIESRISLDDFDLSSIGIIDASHACLARITDKNKLEFIFEDINLSHLDSINKGYVVYRIRLMNSLNEGDTFKNQASIFFDYNYPIITNLETTIIVEETSAVEKVTELDFNIYPNPTDGVLQIDSNLEIESVRVFNTMGRLLLQFDENLSSIDLSVLQQGLYFVEVKIVDQKVTKRVILK